MFPDEAHIQAVRNLCHERGITVLVHFTPVSNIPTILKYGLLSRNVMKTLPNASALQTNDPLRLDDARDYISMSITFPNYQLFYRFRNTLPGPWAITLWDAAILWSYDCLFCQENAASSGVRQLTQAQRRQPDRLQEMFGDFQGVSREALSIPDSCPTHPQAEVLVRQRIDPRFLTGIAFETYQAQHAWSLQINEQPPVVTGVVEDYFKPRIDWEHWKRGGTPKARNTTLDGKPSQVQETSPAPFSSLYSLHITPPQGKHEYSNYHRYPSRTAQCTTSNSQTTPSPPQTPEDSPAVSIESPTVRKRRWWWPWRR